MGRLLPGTDLDGVEPFTLTRRRLRETAYMTAVVVAEFCGAPAAWLACRAAGLPKGILLGIAPVVGMVLGGLLAGNMARVAELLPGR